MQVLRKQKFAKNIFAKKERRYLRFSTSAPVPTALLAVEQVRTGCKATVPVPYRTHLGEIMRVGLTVLCPVMMNRLVWTSFRLPAFPYTPDRKAIICTVLPSPQQKAHQFLAVFRIRIRFFYGSGSRFFFSNTDPDPGKKSPHFFKGNYKNVVGNLFSNQKSTVGRYFI